MKIKIPKRYSKYIDIIFKLGIEDLSNIFMFGMNETIEDIALTGAFPPDMDKSLLQGKEIELEIPFELSEDENEIVEKIQKIFKIKRDTVLKAFFLWGLFDQWIALKCTEQYKKDSKFRKLIDEMPHDLCFESCPKCGQSLNGNYCEKCGYTLY